MTYSSNTFHTRPQGGQLYVMIRIFFILIVAILCFANTANALERDCGTEKEMFSLTKRFGEIQIIQLDGALIPKFEIMEVLSYQEIVNGKIRIYLNPETGTWTAVSLDRVKWACILGVGKGITFKDKETKP